jgi:RimK family alpha-L-glutamate ligase
VLDKHKIDDLLFQEFQNSGFDLRVIVLGGRVLGIMKRTPREGEFLSNYSQGGSIENAKNVNAKKINEIAIKAAEYFMLDYVGVDLMMGNDGGWKVLEVNRACQFKGFEQATGVNIASEVVKYITS